MGTSLTVDFRIDYPPVLEPMFERSRYKAAYGGRGGGKSHFFASLVLKRCLEARTRVVCIREVQRTIRDSVRQLLVDKIQEHGLEDCFEVLETEIRGVNGSLIIFRGMQAYSAHNIKSLEGFDIAFIEEAQTLSDVSWRLLRPTMRKPGSEVWAVWNPRYDNDAIDKFFRGAHPPQDAIVAEINWEDNPLFPDTLKREMLADYESDPEMAEHVWGGGYEIITEGSYYARLIADAEREGRIGDFPYDRNLPVYTAWDIGVDDYTAIWFIQEDGRYATVIDYYETSGEGPEDIVPTCMPELIPDLDEAAMKSLAIGRRVPFEYGKHYLPHDVKNREWGAGGRSRVQILMALGVKPIKRGVAQNPVERIAAARRLLPVTRFTNTERVQLGLKRLRRYRRKWNDHMGTYQGPLHDENSHGADAFGEFAVNAKIAQQKPKPEQRPDDFGYEAETSDRIVMRGSIKDYIERKERERQL